MLIVCILLRFWQLVQILYSIALTWTALSFHKYSVLLRHLFLSPYILQGYVLIQNHCYLVAFSTLDLDQLKDADGLLVALLYLIYWGHYRVIHFRLWQLEVMDVLLMLSHNLAATCAHFVASVSKRRSNIVWQFWYLKATQNNFQVNEWHASGFSTESQALRKFEVWSSESWISVLCGLPEKRDCFFCLGF